MFWPQKIPAHRTSGSSAGFHLRSAPWCPRDISRPPGQYRQRFRDFFADDFRDLLKRELKDRKKELDREKRQADREKAWQDKIDNNKVSRHTVVRSMLCPKPPTYFPCGVATTVLNASNCVTLLLLRNSFVSI